MRHRGPQPGRFTIQDFRAIRRKSDNRSYVKSDRPPKRGLTTTSRRRERPAQTGYFDRRPRTRQNHIFRFFPSRRAGSRSGYFRMEKRLDICAALFALVAAGFWFCSAYGTLPPMVTYWDTTPPNDAFYLAMKHSAKMNTCAAGLSGASAFCMGAKIFLRSTIAAKVLRFFVTVAGLVCVHFRQRDDRHRRS
jgi:hypothetical protein